MTDLPANFPLTKPALSVADAPRAVNDIYTGLQIMYPQMAAAIAAVTGLTNLDGGVSSSVYTGLQSVDCGGAT